MGKAIEKQGTPLKTSGEITEARFRDPKKEAVRNRLVVEKLSNVDRLTNSELFMREEKILHDKSFLIEVAYGADKAYRETYKSQLMAKGEIVPEWLDKPLLSDEEKALLLSGPLNGNIESQEKYDKAHIRYARGVASFYALCEGLGNSTRNNTDPNHAHNTLVDIINHREGDDIVNNMARFAHATWLAGQPFIGRELRNVVRPWDLLSKEDKDLDTAQIRASALAFAKRLAREN